LFIQIGDEYRTNVEDLVLVQKQLHVFAITLRPELAHKRRCYNRTRIYPEVIEAVLLTCAEMVIIILKARKEVENGAIYAIRGGCI
jgi:hypothetical protein